MQKILKTNGNVKEYYEKGVNYSFPKTLKEKCHRCKCFRVFKKHGYYKRYLCTKGFKEYIVVRRYICQCKRFTISLLPDFCVFRISTGFLDILKYTYSVFHRNGTINSVLEILNINNYPVSISRQLFYFYKKRIINNLAIIQIALRSVDPNIKLPNEKLLEIERAKVLLEKMKTLNAKIESFIFTVFNNCHRNPFALCK